MKKIIQAASLVFIAMHVAVLAGCAIAAPKAPTAKEYDLGPLPAVAAEKAPLPAISIAEILAPVWLDTPMMHFRLTYENGLQPRYYANSKWTAPPAQLFAHRLKSRLAQAGGAVLSASDGAANIPLLRLEADDFTQTFSSPGQSIGRVVVRASVFNVRTLVAHRTFIAEKPATTADANGGALALAAASDEVITQMAAWLSQLPAKK